jgi:hypothetical protein
MSWLSAIRQGYRRALGWTVGAGRADGGADVVVASWWRTGRSSRTGGATAGRAPTGSSHAADGDGGQIQIPPALAPVVFAKLKAQALSTQPQLPAGVTVPGLRELVQAKGLGLAQQAGAQQQLADYDAQLRALAQRAQLISGAAGLAGGAGGAYPAAGSDVPAATGWAAGWLGAIDAANRATVPPTTADPVGCSTGHGQVLHWIIVGGSYDGLGFAEMANTRRRAIGNVQLLEPWAMQPQLGLDALGQPLPYIDLSKDDAVAQELNRLLAPVPAVAAALGWAATQQLAQQQAAQAQGQPTAHANHTTCATTADDTTVHTTTAAEEPATAACPEAARTAPSR